jgi:hypothetical protein
LSDKSRLGKQSGRDATILDASVSDGRATTTMKKATTAMKKTKSGSKAGKGGDALGAGLLTPPAQGSMREPRS